MIKSSHIRASYHQWREFGLFAYRKFSSDSILTDKPTLDQDGLRIFKNLIAKTRVYLEYGSGGSTLFAAKHVELLVTVDSDRMFLKSVKSAVSQYPSMSRFWPIYVDVGFTTTWGNPLFTRPTAARLRRWSRYATSPWDYLNNEGVEPDTILIDGRFRVACALHCFLNLRASSSCNILVDDYANNLHYRPIEQFGELIALHGRMALFRKRHTMDDTCCRDAVEKFYSDFR
jgi:hypothetical protein